LAPKTIPLILVVEGEAVVEEFGPLLARVTGQLPVAAPKASRLEKTSNVSVAVIDTPRVVGR
jgi:hypothetical protein